MKDLLDLHTHTIASGHAYNTINEMILAASEKGLKVLGITEHAPEMPGTCSNLYFVNYRVLPREKMGVQVFYGVELNILDYNGHVDLPRNILAGTDLAIASIHPPCFKGGTMEENTRAYVNAMKNPYINIIGHPDDGRFPVDYKVLVEAAKEWEVLLEVNNSSLSPNSYRHHAVENYYKMLEYCKLYEVPIVINSDAHVEIDVGNHQFGWKILKEVDFPEQLIVNIEPQILEKYINYFKR